MLSLSIAETSFNSKPSSPDMKKGRLNHFSMPGSIPYDLEAAGSSRSTINSVPLIRQCGIEGCRSIALGGKCDFRICCSNGCNRILCKEHTAKSENPDEDGMKDKVCTECQPKVDLITWMWLIIIIGLPFLLSLPAVFLYANKTGELWNIKQSELHDESTAIRWRYYELTWQKLLSMRMTAIGQDDNCCWEMPTSSHEAYMAWWRGKLIWSTNTEWHLFLHSDN